MAFFSDTIAAIAAGRVVHAAILAEHDFNEGIAYNWTGWGDLEYGGRIYKGTGDLATIGELFFGDDDAAQPLTCTLSGVKPELVVEARTAPTVRGRSQRFFLLFFDAVTLQPLDNPYLLAERVMDVLTYSGVGPTGRSISVTSEDIWNQRATTEYASYSQSDQEGLFPGDLGLEFVAEMIPGMRIEWPDFSNE